MHSVIQRKGPAALASARLIGKQGQAVRSKYNAPYGISSLFDLLAEETVIPSLKWLIAGRAGAVNRMHRDIWNTAAWNVLLVGLKRWILVSPRCEDGKKRFLCEQKAGDVLFIPSAWQHEVLYLENSVAITENYIDLDNAKVVSAAMREDARPDLSLVVDRIADRVAG